MYERMMRKIIILILMLYLSGCSPAVSNADLKEEDKIQEKILKGQESEKIIKDDYNIVFRNVMAVLIEKQYDIDKVDKGSGFISTDWFEGEVFNRAVRAKITVNVKKIRENRTSVLVNLDAKVKSESGNWESMSVESAKSVYNNIFEAISQKISNEQEKPISEKESETKKNLAAIRSAVSIYYSETEGVWPKSITEGFSRYLSPIPAELITGSNKVVTSFDGTGGWYYVTDFTRIDGAYVYLNLNGNDSKGKPYKGWEY